MKTAIFERSTSAARPSVISIYLGPGDTRELLIDDAERLCDWIDFMTEQEIGPIKIAFGEGDIRLFSHDKAEELYESLEAALSDWSNYYDL